MTDSGWTEKKQRELEELERLYPGAVPPDPTAPADPEWTAEKQAELEALEQKYPGAVPPPIERKDWAYWKGTAPADKQIKHAVKGIGRGLYDLLESPYNYEQLINQGVQLGGFEGGKTSEKGVLEAAYTPIVEDLRERRGYDLPSYEKVKETLAGEELRREEAPLADSIRTFFEWGGPQLPFKAGRRGLARVMGRDAPPTSLAREVAPDIGAGVAATTGEMVESTITPIGDQPSGLGEMLGIVGGFLGGHYSAPKQIKAQQTAYKFIQDHAENPEKAIANIKAAVARGEGGKGSLATLADDPGLYNIEAGSLIAARTRGDQGLARELQRVDDEFHKMLVGDIIGPEKDVAPTAADAAKTRAEDLRWWVNERAQQQKTLAQREATTARKAATDAEVPLDTTKRPAEASVDLYQAVEQGQASRKLAEDAAWAEWRETDSLVDVRPIYAKVNEHLKGNYDDLELRRWAGKYGTLIKQANVWKKKLRTEVDRATRNDVSTWYSEIEDAIQEAQSKNLRKDERFLIGLKKAAEEGLEAGSPLYKKAVKHTRIKHELYTDSLLGSARGRAKSEGPETFFSRLGRMTDETGAQLIREINATEDPVLQNALIEMLKSEAKTNYGGVTPEFLAKYEDLVRNMESDVARNQFRTAGEAEGLARARADEAKAVAEKVEARKPRLNQTIEKSVITKYGDTPELVLDNLLDRTTDTRELKTLTQFMDNNNQGAAFRDKIKERIRSKFFRTGEGLPHARAADIARFSDTRKALVDAGVLTAQEAESMSITMNRTLSLAQRQKALNAQMEVQSEEAQQLVASVISAMTLNVLPGGGTESLMMGGAVRRWVRKRLRRGADLPAVEALERMIINPEYYADAAKNAKSIDQAMDLILTKAIGIGQVGATGEEGGLY
jgi:hypothetical protein